MEQVLLSLYICGTSPQSMKALKQIQDFCKRSTNLEITLDVIDILEQPDRAEVDKIVATPTLVRLVPLPVQRYLGDFTKSPNVLNQLFSFINPSCR